MPAIWICRDENGVVDAAYVAEHTDPRILKELRDNGRTPELVVADTVTLGQPLPRDVAILQ